MGEKVDLEGVKRSNGEAHRHEPLANGLTRQRKGMNDMNDGVPTNKEVIDSLDLIRMSDAGLEDNSSSSIYNIIPYPEDLLDGIPGFSRQHQDSLCSASVSSDEQFDAETDMKNWETAEDDDADSICSCSSNRSMGDRKDFQREDPPDGQESDLEAESQNSLHNQSPSEEKESEHDDPAGGRNRFTENKNSNDSPYLDFPKKVFFSPGHHIADIRCGRLSA